MKYKIICEKKAVSLEKEVQELLNNGWYLHGTLVIMGSHMCQAMVKKEATRFMELGEGYFE